VLRLLQDAVDRADHRRLGGHRPKVVVEDAEPNDVEAERQKLGLHIDGRAGVRGGAELGGRASGAAAKHGDRGVDVGLVEAGHDLAAPDLPGLEVRGDQALAHDRLEDLREHALVVVERVVAEEVARDDRVGDDNEGLLRVAGG
jgi:hypothetical protein